MRLEYICDLELAYREEPTYEGKLFWFAPMEVKKERGMAKGTALRSQAPGKSALGEPSPSTERRSDVTRRPWVILADDGAQILFTLQGRTFFEDDTGKQLLHTTFEAEDQRYRWLRGGVCVLEGVIGTPKLEHACTHICMRARPRPDAICHRNEDDDDAAHWRKSAPM